MEELVARAEWKETKSKGGNTNSRVEVRVRSSGGEEGHMGANKLNEAQEDERESESRVETEKEQTHRQLTNEKR